MKLKLRPVRVSPVLPGPLEPLERLAHNLCWDWIPELAELFMRIDAERWERCGRNPIVLLGQVDQKRLERLAVDGSFLGRLRGAEETLERYQKEPRWFQKTKSPEEQTLSVAYFCAEFGLTGCMPIYSGGLGILAGDHLKSASDLGLPLVGVGLLYQEGYFRQYLNSDGWQEELYPPNDFYNLPIKPARHADGSVVKISVEFPGRLVWAQIWQAMVGRVPLFLLDTNVPENSEEDRKITRALYSGGMELRLQQLMVLGIGGFRALVALGREPAVCHMNEGHAGFLGVERTRYLMEKRGLSYEVARDIVDDGNIFTTHTPVPAGFDVFSQDLVERHMSEYIRKVGLTIDQFMSLGRRDLASHGEPLNMAVVAIRHAVMRNGVSELHGKVSRRLVHTGQGWLDWPEDEVPIESVTNGIHTRTWMAPEMIALFDRHLGPAWYNDIGRPETWAAIDAIPDEDLWHAHTDLRHKLVGYVRGRLLWQLGRRGATERELSDASSALNPNALTIGFARRFATYKRGTLLFTDSERLKRILCSKERPVQFIFSGKAHPADIPAKELIKTIASYRKQEDFARSIFFLEDYEIPVAKAMVRGVDVWLNTPQRPREASGTSGMKVVANGGLNLSILDGWWAEAYRPGIGWAIGSGEDYDPARDSVEANALYNLLETQVVPTFYERDRNNIPTHWVQMVKASMKSLAAQFSSDRMVVEYVDRFYLPTASRFQQRSSGDRETAEDAVAWKQKIRSHWREVQIVEVTSPGNGTRIGASFEVTARVRLGSFTTDDVDVQLYHGVLDAKDEVHDPTALSMKHVAQVDGLHEYQAELHFGSSGRHGYTVRIIPKNPNVLIPNELTAIRWAEV